LRHSLLLSKFPASLAYSEPRLTQVLWHYDSTFLVFIELEFLHASRFSFFTSALNEFRIGNPNSR
jgi:hypothetical protein